MSSSATISVRWAQDEDLDFAAQDGQVSPQVVARKIRQREVVVAGVGSELIGYARLEYLWSKVPYIALIWVVEKQRRRGVGRAMLSFLETELGREGYPRLYSSSQENETEPQEWHRHMGFSRCGLIEGINEGGIGEVFFHKEL